LLFCEYLDNLIERIQKKQGIFMAKTNNTNIGFEKQIWDAACVLRGNMDASEYKSVVLGLIFLKYISDRFDEKYEQKLYEKNIDNIIGKYGNIKNLWNSNLFDWTGY
jgi:type I restriction-modification system DNA methylase subunit